MAETGVPEFREQFEDIWLSTQGVSRERFDQAIEFGMLIMRGWDKYRAYEHVFGECSNVHMQTISFMSSRYVNLILERFQDIKYGMLLDKHMAVLGEMYHLSTGEGVSPRTKIDAGRTFLEYTKRPDTLKVEHTHQHNVALELKGKLDETLKLVSSQGRLVAPDGSVTDAEIVLE